MSSQWTSQNVAYSSAFTGPEIELHLVQSTAQLHFVRDVIVDVEHLGFSIAAIGNEQLNVQVVAFVEVVGRQGTLNFNIAVARNP